MRRWALPLLACVVGLLWAVPSAGQVRESGVSGGATSVNCVQGCSGGTTDTDDGSVAGGQSTGINISLLQLWNGSAWVRATGDATNGLKVQCASGCTPGGSFADNGAFTFGTTAISVAGFVFDDVAPNAATENSAAAPRMSSNRVQYHILRDAAGNERGANVTASNALVVDGSAVTQPVSLASVPSHAVTNAGTFAVQADTELPAAAALSDTTANPTTPMIGAGLMVWDGSTNWLRAKGDANGLGVQGAVAHDGANVQNTKPLAVGGRASAAVPTDVSADNDAVMAWYLRSGAAAIQPTFGGVLATTGNGVSGTGVQRVTLASDSTGQVTLAAGAATIGAVTQASGPWTSNLTQVNSAAVNVGTGAAGTGTLRVATSTDSTIGTVTAVTAITNALPAGANVIGALTANQSVNVSQINGVAPSMGNGASGTGVQRVTIANDSTGTIIATQATGTNLHMVCDSGCTPGGSFADKSAFTAGSTAINVGGYVVDEALPTTVLEDTAGAPRMNANRIAYSDLSKDSSGLTTLLQQLTLLVSDLHAGKLPARGDLAGLGVRGAFNTPIGSVGDSLKVVQTNQDPCVNPVKNDAAISQTATSRIIPSVAGARIYICQIRLIAAAAEIVSELEGTGTNCGTGTIAHSGSTTAANGESYAANAGYQSGSGEATVVSLPPGKDFCVGQSGSNRVSGKVSYVYAP